MLPLAVATFFLLFFVVLLDLRSPTVIDYLYCLVIVFILYVCSKKNVFFVVNSALLLFLLYVSGAMKLQYFGEPATPADIVSLVALYTLQSEMVKGFVVFLISLSLVFLFFNLVYTRRLLTVFTAMIVTLFSSVLLGANIDASSSYLKGLSKSESVSIRQYYATVRFYDEWLRQPSRAEVAAAHNKFDYSRVAWESMGDGIKRDVYVIVIESLWDPSVLGDRYVDDPLHEGFRVLWNESGQRYLLGPAFGGGTANPEFEILCGVPLNSGFIVFQHPLLNDNLPCLPNVLAREGYRTVASHPNHRGFWNRDFAYPAMGFDEYHSIDGFEKDEIIGNNYLSDRSLYRQHMDIVGKEPDPRFHYILTVSAHYPYSSAALGVGVNNEPMRLFNSYVELVERGTKDIYEYIESIRATDKDALIVVLGDHPPLFGKDFAVYRDAGLIVNKKNAMSVRELLYLYSTPIVVIDGVNGAVTPAIKSMYEIPSMIMQMLECYNKECEGYINDHQFHYRPVSDRGVLYYTEGEWGFCAELESSPGCSRHLDWLHASTVVRNDLVLGGWAENIDGH